MKPTGNHHPLSITLLLFILLSPEITNPVKAQSGGQGSSTVYASITPSIAIIIAILIAALFFMAFFSIYIRHCSDVGTGNNVVRRALSMRGRRPAVAPGLDAAVLETFPMFSYSEVKDHKIGKGALECAVCLCEFEDDEKLRLIPKCDHVFHPECIDAWLESHVTCPVCRANLVPQPGDEPFNLPESVSTNTEDSQQATVERSSSINEEVVIQVDQEPKINRNLSFVNLNRPQRSWSVKVFGLGKFRSHSTGHSLVQPGENLERFTLRLPAHVRKDVMHRAALNRTGSCAAATLPREGSSRRGYRGEGGRFRQIDHRSDREPKSERWDSFMRTFSMKSHKVGAENGQSSSSVVGSSRIPVKLPSLKCLEPKAADETLLFSGEPSVKSPV